MSELMPIGRSHAPRACFTCAHFAFFTGTRDYSETPGDDVEMYCGKHHWRLDPYRDTRPDVQRYLGMARTCADFTPETPKEPGGAA